MGDERRVWNKNTGLGQAAVAAELEGYREVAAVAKKKQLAWHSFAYGM